MTSLQAGSPASLVAVDASTGRPREIRVGRQRLPLTILSVRDETAAYPAGSGPRVLFVVRSRGRRFRLIHLHRDRRWLVEALDRVPGVLLPMAA